MRLAYAAFVSEFSGKPYDQNVAAYFICNIRTEARQAHLAIFVCDFSSARFEWRRLGAQNCFYARAVGRLGFVFSFEDEYTSVLGVMGSSFTCRAKQSTEDR